MTMIVRRNKEQLQKCASVASSRTFYPIFTLRPRWQNNSCCFTPSLAGDSPLRSHFADCKKLLKATKTLKSHFCKKRKENLTFLEQKMWGFFSAIKRTPAGIGDGQPGAAPPDMPGPGPQAPPPVCPHARACVRE